MRMFGRHIWYYLFASWMSLDLWKRLVSLCKRKPEKMDNYNIIELNYKCNRTMSAYYFTAWLSKFVSPFFVLVQCSEFYMCRFRSFWGRGKRKLVRQKQRIACAVWLSKPGGEVLRSDRNLAAGTWGHQELGWINVVALHRLTPVCPGLSCNGIGVAADPIFCENEFSSKYCTRRS